MKINILLMCASLSACTLTNKNFGLQPEKSYVATEFIGDVFSDSSKKYSMVDFFDSMGFDETDLDQSISTRGYWFTDNQILILGDGGTPTFLLEKKESSQFEFRLFVSRFELDYADRSIIRLIDGRWKVIETIVVKSDYLNSQISTIQINGVNGVKVHRFTIKQRMSYQHPLTSAFPLVVFPGLANMPTAFQTGDPAKPPPDLVPLTAPALRPAL
jgi:hypothetical protein